jgi:hypothetical protein
MRLFCATRYWLPGYDQAAYESSDFYLSLQEVTTVEKWYEYMATTFYDHVYIGDR